MEFELFKNSRFSLTDETTLKTLWATHSWVLTGNLDYATAMYCTLVAQGLTLPQQNGLCDLPGSMRERSTTTDRNRKLE